MEIKKAVFFQKESQSHAKSDQLAAHACKLKIQFHNSVDTRVFSDVLVFICSLLIKIHKYCYSITDSRESF